MKDISVELKVGIFAIIVIMALTYMTFKVGSLPMIWEKGYRLYVTLDDTSGLDEKSRIKIAGVEAGMIDRINLVEGKAKVTILLKPDVKVYKDAEVSLRMSGLLGDRHLALATGSPEQPLLKNGDTILNVKPATDIDMLVSRLTDAAGNIGDLTSNINGIFGKEERKAIREAMYNLRDVTSSLKDISEQNKVPLNNIIARIDTFTKSMDKKGPVLIDDLTSAANELKTIIQENRGSFRDSMENIKGFSSSAGVIAKRLEKGEGTLGKLLQEDELYN
ncbi:MAG TPA: MCE family protein, partial [Nitrospirae bacterium]|nr:MCE family protein [Nitrospirota bacterium]